MFPDEIVLSSVADIVVSGWGKIISIFPDRLDIWQISVNSYLYIIQMWILFIIYIYI